MMKRRRCAFGSADPDLGKVSVGGMSLQLLVRVLVVSGEVSGGLHSRGRPSHER